MPRKYLVLAALCLVSAAVHAEAVRCPLDRTDERVVSAKVHDGDTLRLTDGRKVRLLGINTPELGRDGEPSEPFAAKARRVLESLAGPGETLRIRVDEQRRDKYGRLLAHVFREDGVNVQERLLAAGVATLLTVPPNGWAWQCYARVEADARGAKAGIWALPRYQPVAAEALAESDRGYRVITGRVQRIGESRRNLWLNLTPEVAIRIAKTDLAYFTGYSPRRLQGRRVEARGWVYRSRGQLRVAVRHPAALMVLD